MTNISTCVIEHLDGERLIVLNTPACSQALSILSAGDVIEVLLQAQIFASDPNYIVPPAAPRVLPERRLPGPPRIDATELMESI